MTFPVTSSSSSSSSKRQRSTNDGDGDGGAESDCYHHETLLLPSKAATESSGIATLDDMVEHLVEALKQKLKVPLATAVEAQWKDQSHRISISRSRFQDD